MTNKILSIILLCCMLLSVTNTYAKTNVDTVDSAIVDVVTGLGLMDYESDGDFHGEKVMTRRDGAEVFARILFGSNSVSASVPVFKDVEDNSYIHSLCDAGIVSKAELFRPNGELSLEQAVTMLTRLMGYEVIAASAGGYPYGYLNAAAAEDILDGINTVGSDRSITKYTMALMLYNALEAPRLENISYGDEASYRKNPSSTILASMGITTVDGKIVANEYASVESIAESAPGYVTLRSSQDGTICTYKLGISSDVAAMLNLEGVFYIKNSNGLRDELLCAEFENLDTLTVTGPEIISVSDEELIYLGEDDEEEVAEFSPDLAVVYNDKSISGDKFIYLQPETGKVVLYRFNGDKEYKTAFVYDYETALAERSYDTGVIVKNPGNGTTTYDFADYTSVKVVKDGKEAELDDIEEWDVLHFARSADGDHATIEASSKSFIHGKINGINDGDVQIGEETYSVDGTVISDNIYGALSLGDTAKFYFNANGKIFAYVTDKIMERLMYGYILAYAPGRGIDGNVRFKVLNEYGVVTSYDAADKIRVNVAGTGESYWVINGTHSECPRLFDAEDNVIGQLVKYKLNTNNEISSIELAQNLEETNVPSDNSTFSLVRSGVLRYDNYNGGRFDNQYIMTTKTKVFLIPEDRDVDKMEVTTPGTAFTGIYNNVLIPDGQVYIYNVNQYCQPEYVVYHVQPKYTPNNDSATLVINKVVHSIRSNGDEGYKLYGYASGKSVVHFLSDDIDHTELNQGDFALYKTDSNGIIVGLRKIYAYNPSEANFVESISSNSTSRNDAVDWRGDITVFSGNAYSVTPDGGYVVMSTDLPWDVKRGFKSSANYYLFDTENKEIRPAKYTDLHCSSANPAKVVARMRRAAVTDIMIIE